VTRGGRPYKGLALGALQITENGVSIQPSELTEVRAPVTLHFLFDLSTSNERHIFLAKKAAGELVSKMKAGDRAKISFFSSAYQPLTAYTEDREALSRSLSFLTSVGSTALYDGIAAALRELGEVSGPRVLVLFSDGHDLMSRTTEEALMTDIRNFRVPVVFVRFGEGNTRGKDLLAAQVQFMTRLAEESGGLVVEGVPGHTRDLMKNIKGYQDRYLVRFRPPGPDDLELWRSLVVRIPSCPECDIEYRKAYSIRDMQATP